MGGYYDNTSAGAAWVYTRSGGVWGQQGNKLVGTGAIGAAQQGGSVSLSSDGNTAIVGGRADNGSAGAAWVYTRSAGVWTQQGSKLVGTGAVRGGTGVSQGVSVDLSSDGNTAIVGGDGDSSNTGAAWVWTRAGAAWTQLGTKLVGTSATQSGLGYSISLSADGNTAMAGGPSFGSLAGAVWVFTRSGTPVLPQGFAVQSLIGVKGEYLRFDLPRKERVVIQLLNAKGQRVSQLLDETRNAGYYTVPLSKVAQGAYFLDFRAGDFHRTIKIR